MPSFILIILFLCIYISIMLFEKRKYGNILTPYFFLATPFIVICILSELFGGFVGFLKINNDLYMYWIVYLLVFSLGSFVIAPMVKIKKNLLKKEEPVRRVNVISIVSIIVSIILFVVALRLILSNPSIHYIASEDFSSAYGKGLLLPILRTTAMICLVYLIGFTSKKNYLSQISILITLIPFFIYQVKNFIILTVVAGIIFRIVVGNLKITLKLIWIIIIVGVCIFIVTYALPLLLISGTEAVFSVDFLMNRLEAVLSYLFSGILGFNYLLYFDVNIPNEATRIFAPAWNLLRHITGWDRVDSIITDYFFPINEIGSKKSNVFTIFGNMHTYLGFYGTIIMSYFIGVISYLVKALSDRKESTWFSILNCFNLSILSLGWFDYYYNQTFIWIFFTIVLCIYYYSKVKKPKIVLYKTISKF